MELFPETKKWRADQGELSCFQYLSHSIAPYGNLDQKMVRKKMVQRDRE